MASISHAAPTPADQRNAVMAGFLGWTLDAFDFFILVMVVPAVARDFHKSVPAIARTLTASLVWFVVMFGPEAHGVLFVAKTEPPAGEEPEPLRPTGT
jgi:hypothetical protein